jgi:hypothetical protein
MSDLRPSNDQGDLFPLEHTGLFEQAACVTLELLKTGQPSPWDLLQSIEQKVGWKARCLVKDVLKALLASSPTLPRAMREYLESLKDSRDLDAALRGTDAPRKEVASTVDMLLRRSKVYSDSGQFREMISFMARFRGYAPYNNMLVHLQDPTCSFFATQNDWEHRFKRNLKEDARPMLILAPMHPVMLVYALDQTEGPALPAEISSFAHFEGPWNPRLLQRAIRNAAMRDRIRVDFKTLSSTNAGFATSRPGTPEWKMRIVIHAELEEPSQYGVLCHELAHIYLGHLGSDEDHWWPSRRSLDWRTVEIEAEAAAFIVTTHLGLAGSSPAYVSRYLNCDSLPQSVSLDHVAKVADRIERMSNNTLSLRKSRRVGPHAE